MVYPIVSPLYRAFWDAVQLGEVENLINCVNEGIKIDQNGMEALVVACCLGKIDIVRCLTNIYNMNPSIKGRLELCELTNEWRYQYENRRTVKYHIGKDYAAFTDIDIWGKNALHVACVYGHLDVIDHLIHQCNININTPNYKNQWTAFQYAVHHYRFEVVQYLLNNGISNRSIHLQTSKGNALSLAVTGKLFDRNDQHVEMAQYLVDEQKIDINVQGESGRTALHEAFYRGRVIMINYLLSLKDINVHIQDQSGDTALHYACSGYASGKLEIVQDFVNQHHVDINIPGKDGYTALHLAIKFDHVDLASFLLDKGADITCTTNDGENVFDFALKSHYCNDYVIKFLKKLLHTTKN